MGFNGSSLEIYIVSGYQKNGNGWMMDHHLHLGISPPRDLNYHVQHSLLVIGIKGNVVERRKHDSILLNVDTVLQGVGSTNLPDGITT